MIIKGYRKEELRKEYGYGKDQRSIFERIGDKRAEEKRKEENRWKNF